MSCISKQWESSPAQNPTDPQGTSSNGSDAEGEPHLALHTVSHLFLAEKQLSSWTRKYFRMI